MKKQILVVTATLGDRDTLSRTIASVKAIGGDSVHHVIVAPQNMVDGIKSKYQDVECIPEQGGKRGIYAALNYGLMLYANEYEYLTFINDDDYWLPEFRMLIDAIMSNGLDLVYGKTRYVDSNNISLGEQTSSGRFHDFLPLLYSNIILFTQQATIIRSEWYLKMNGFDESYKLVADTKFWSKLSLVNIKYKYFNRCCAAYCIQEGQLSSDHDTQAVEHKRLLSELPGVSSSRAKIAKIRFRMANVGVYMKRFLKNKTSVNPFSRGVKY